MVALIRKEELSVNFEATMIGLRRKGGEVKDRERLTANQILGLRALLPQTLRISETMFAMWMNRVYHTVYNSMLDWRCQLRDQRNTCATTPKSIRDELRLFNETFEIGDAQEQYPSCRLIRRAVCDLGKEARDFLDQVAANDPACPPKTADLIRRELSQEQCGLFLVHCNQSASIIAQIVKRGHRGEPVLKQMCSALGSIYLHAAGTVPKRQVTSRGSEPLEAGPLLDLATTFERIIDRSLPKELQIKEQTAMVRMCRDVSEELEQLHAAQTE